MGMGLSAKDRVGKSFFFMGFVDTNKYTEYLQPYPLSANGKRIHSVMLMIQSIKHCSAQ